jgi:hypothetical protein
VTALTAIRDPWATSRARRRLAPFRQRTGTSLARAPLQLVHGLHGGLRAVAMISLRIAVTGSSLDATVAPRTNTAIFTRIFFWALQQIRRLLCAVTAQHEMVRYLEPHRIALRCLSCGYQTRGWTIGVDPSNPATVDDLRRAA